MRRNAKIIRKTIGDLMIIVLFLLMSGFEEFFIFLTVLTFFLLFTAIFIERDRFLRLAVVFRTRKRTKRCGSINAFPFPPAASYDKETVREEKDFPSSVLNAAAADSLISDKMAKNLIHRAPSIKVFGSKKRIVNLGELSRAFKDGERVDVNRMKAVGIIPYDTLKIKVLASGELDKKLFVYANGFSKTAVKMIALKGGEAVVSHSERVKMPRETD